MLAILEPQTLDIGIPTPKQFFRQDAKELGGQAGKKPGWHTSFETYVPLEDLSKLTHFHLMFCFQQIGIFPMEKHCQKISD